MTATTGQYRVSHRVGDVPACRCTICGRPIRRDNKYGICRRTTECRQAYYAADRDKFKARTRACRAANRDKIKAHNRAYRAANRDEIKAYNHAYYAANRDKIIALRRARRDRKGGMRNCECGIVNAECGKEGTD